MGGQMKELNSIAVIGNFGTSWDGSIPDESHIADCLTVLGYSVTTQQREDGIPKGNFDLVVVSQWNGYKKDFILNMKKKLKCPVVYWAFDYQFDSHEDWHFEMAEQADLFLSPEMGHMEQYIQRGVNFRWLPQGFAPMFLDKMNVFKEYDVVFTGTYLPQCQFRTDVLKAVSEQYNLDVFSVTQNEWKAQGLQRVNGPVIDYDLPELYGKAKVVLSVDLFPGVMGSWSDRNAQAMACGACVLYKYAPLSEEEFGDGVVYFKTIEECLARIDFLLKNQDIASEIAKNGYIIARTKLMAIHRVKNLITIVEHEL